MGEIAARGCRRAGRHRRQPAQRGPAAIRAAILGRAPGAGAPRSSRSATGARPSREAVRRAGPGDIVLVAGKGHETGQEVAGDVHPFDDREACAPRGAGAR